MFTKDITFNKHKSDAVGVGVSKGITDLHSHICSNNSEMPDDPLKEQKHTNKPMSNIPTSNTAITLVALVITIIVLLILTGVTLNMVIGNNGIFKKANKASEETKKSSVVEDIRLKVLEVQTKELGNISLEKNSRRTRKSSGYIRNRNKK